MKIAFGFVSIELSDDHCKNCFYGQDVNWSGLKEMKTTLP